MSAPMIKTLLALLLLIPSLSFGDHYKTGIFFADPNYQGCKLFPNIHSLNFLRI